jgi:hypothetical protein
MPVDACVTAFVTADLTATPSSDLERKSSRVEVSRREWALPRGWPLTCSHTRQSLGEGRRDYGLIQETQNGEYKRALGSYFIPVQARVLSAVRDESRVLLT